MSLDEMIKNKLPGGANATLKTRSKRIALSALRVRGIRSSARADTRD